MARPVSAGSAEIDAASDTAVTFSGARDVTVPAGAEYLSDAVAFPVAPLSNLAISIHFDQPPTGETGHPGSRTTSYLAHGDMVSAATLPDANKQVEALVPGFGSRCDFAYAGELSGDSGRFDCGRAWSDDERKRSLAGRIGGAYAG